MAASLWLGLVLHTGTPVTHGPRSEAEAAAWRRYHPLVRSVDVVDRLPPGDTARYFGLVRVPPAFQPAFAGEHFVFARRCLRPPVLEATTVVWTHASAGSLLGGGPSAAPARTLVTDHSVAHNFAAVFAAGGRALVGAGGEYWAKAEPSLNESALGRPRGVIVRRATRRDQVLRADFDEWAWVTRVRGDAPGCIEARRKLHLFDARRSRLVCEFDGLLSFARRSAEFGGGTLMYARANVSPVPEHGRHVQVARVRALGTAAERWGEFVPLAIDGHSAEAHNVYFGAVNANPADGGRTLLGLFPTWLAPSAPAAQPECFIGLALSCDGVAFSRLHRLGASPCASGGRTADQPVDGLVVEGEMVHAYVHVDVGGLTTSWHDARAPTASRILRLTLRLSELANHTARALEGSSEAVRHSCAHMAAGETSGGDDAWPPRSRLHPGAAAGPTVEKVRAPPKVMMRAPASAHKGARGEMLRGGWRSPFAKRRRKRAGARDAHPFAVLERLVISVWRLRGLRLALLVGLLLTTALLLSLRLPVSDLIRQRPAGGARSTRQEL